MFVLVAYDVADDKLRTRVAKVLEGFGARVQRSVFECDLKPEAVERLRKRLQRIELGPEDSIRYYRLCAACTEDIIIDGVGEVQRTPLAYIL